MTTSCICESKIVQMGTAALAGLACFTGIRKVIQGSKWPAVVGGVVSAGAIGTMLHSVYKQSNPWRLEGHTAEQTAFQTAWAQLPSELQGNWEYRFDATSQARVDAGDATELEVILIQKTDNGDNDPVKQYLPVSKCQGNGLAALVEWELKLGEGKSAHQFAGERANQLQDLLPEEFHFQLSAAETWDDPATQRITICDGRNQPVLIIPVANWQRMDRTAMSAVLVASAGPWKNQGFEEQKQLFEAAWAELTPELRENWEYCFDGRSQARVDDEEATELEIFFVQKTAAVVEGEDPVTHYIPISECRDPGLLALLEWELKLASGQDEYDLVVERANAFSELLDPAYEINYVTSDEWSDKPFIAVFKKEDSDLFIAAFGTTDWKRMTNSEFQQLVTSALTNSWTLEGYGSEREVFEAAWSELPEELQREWKYNLDVSSRVFVEAGETTELSVRLQSIDTNDGYCLPLSECHGPGLSALIEWKMKKHKNNQSNYKLAEKRVAQLQEFCKDGLRFDLGFECDWKWNKDEAKVTVYDSLDELLVEIPMAQWRRMTPERFQALLLDQPIWAVKGHNEQRSVFIAAWNSLPDVLQGRWEYRCDEMSQARLDRGDASELEVILTEREVDDPRQCYLPLSECCGSGLSELLEWELRLAEGQTDWQIAQERVHQLSESIDDWYTLQCPSEEVWQDPQGQKVSLCDYDGSVITDFTLAKLKRMTMDEFEELLASCPGDPWKLPGFEEEKELFEAAWNKLPEELREGCAYHLSTESKREIVENERREVAICLESKEKGEYRWSFRDENYWLPLSDCHGPGLSALLEWKLKRQEGQNACELVKERIEQLQTLLPTGYSFEVEPEEESEDHDYSAYEVAAKLKPPGPDAEEIEITYAEFSRMDSEEFSEIVNRYPKRLQIFQEVWNALDPTSTNGWEWKPVKEFSLWNIAKVNQQNSWKSFQVDKEVFDEGRLEAYLNRRLQGKDLYDCKECIEQLKPHLPVGWTFEEETEFGYIALKCEQKNFIKTFWEDDVNSLDERSLAKIIRYSGCDFRPAAIAES